MTATLTPTQLTLVEVSAELRGLSDLLRWDCDDDSAPPDDGRRLLAERLRRLSQRLYDAVEDV